MLVKYIIKYIKNILCILCIMSDEEMNIHELVVGKKYLIKKFGPNNTMLNQYIGSYVKYFGNIVDFVNITEIEGYPLTKTEIHNSQRILVTEPHEEICYSKVYKLPDIVFAEE